MLHYFQGTYRSKDVLCRAKGSLVGGHLVDNLKCEFDYFRFPNSIEHCLIEWVRLGWIWFAWLRLVPEKEFAQSSVFDFVGLPNPIELNPLIEFDWVRFPNVRLTVTGSGKREAECVSSPSVTKHWMPFLATSKTGKRVGLCGLLLPLRRYKRKLKTAFLRNWNQIPRQSRHSVSLFSVQHDKDLLNTYRAFRAAHYFVAIVP